VLSYYCLYNIFPSDYPMSREQSSAGVVDSSNDTDVSPLNFSDDNPRSEVTAITDSSSVVHPARVNRILQDFKNKDNHSLEDSLQDKIVNGSK
jgi:hypothetical protein